MSSVKNSSFFGAILVVFFISLSWHARALEYTPFELELMMRPYGKYDIYSGQITIDYADSQVGDWVVYRTGDSLLKYTISEKYIEFVQYGNVKFMDIKIPIRMLKWKKELVYLYNQKGVNYPVIDSDGYLVSSFDDLITGNYSNIIRGIGDLVIDSEGRMISGIGNLVVDQDGNIINGFTVGLKSEETSLEEVVAVYPGEWLSPLKVNFILVPINKKTISLIEVNRYDYSGEIKWCEYISLDVPAPEDVKAWSVYPDGVVETYRTVLVDYYCKSKQKGEE